MARGRVFRAVVLREREDIRYSVLTKLFLRRLREVWAPDLFRQRDEHAVEGDTERIRRRRHVSSNANSNHGMAARVCVQASVSARRVSDHTSDQHLELARHDFGLIHERNQSGDEKSHAVIPGQLPGKSLPILHHQRSHHIHRHLVHY